MPKATATDNTPSEILFLEEQDNQTGNAYIRIQYPDPDSGEPRRSWIRVYGNFPDVG